ncbi:hypothetical protein SDRG_14313 [Saprolegnia diclina VS20]|uniref:F-box domain-containing protein n=1 Tax=Saprolegnia diclina (strain VS20) TaxID=1156394 RepID=T0RE57_SAPDV|nr:hypothetical protein SDRG_14313 [Saprolegnia diclina VS20]EQC27892.1 hypothetical protein SDRG_14313 [Saprolegnia diclina VS20]|eukprot:XP_008618657.1 hypothetical protein SDRG_14313 [Saprolegnia diclina VS20]
MDRLAPESLQCIAAYVADANELVAFLRLLPTTALGPSFSVLVTTRRLHRRWPRFFMDADVGGDDIVALQSLVTSVHVPSLKALYQVTSNAVLRSHVLIQLVPPIHPYKLQHPVLLHVRSRLSCLHLAIPTMEMPAPRIKALISFLAACPRLLTLHLAWRVQLQPAVLQALVDKAVIAQGLTELALQSDVTYELPDALASDLACWIQQRPSLTTLKLESIAMTDAASKNVFATLLALPQLTTLSLQSSAALAAQCWRPQRLPSQLRTLDISAWDGRASMDAIVALRTVPHLRDFALRGHANVDFSFEIPRRLHRLSLCVGQVPSSRSWWEALPSSLHDLELQLGRGDDDVALLTACLLRLPKLQRLTLNESNITCDGAIQLAAVLPHCQLQSLPL